MLLLLDLSSVSLCAHLYTHIPTGRLYVCTQHFRPVVKIKESHERDGRDREKGGMTRMRQAERGKKKKKTRKNRPPTEEDRYITYTHTTGKDGWT